MKKVEIAFLSKDLNKETYEFGKRIQQELGLRVVFIVDKESNGYLSTKDLVVFQVEDANCIASGYQNCMITNEKINTVLQRNPCAYDKFLYYYNIVSPKTKFVFMFEDDCFIPSLEVITNLISKYSSYDLVVPNNRLKSDTVLDWHWESVFKKVGAPRYYSMVGAMGISRKLFNVIASQVKDKGTLFFTEVMFNTLAMQNKLKVIDVFELKSIVWMGAWGLDEFLLLPNNVFHPMKELDKFEEYREDIKQAKRKKYKPKNKLPNFIKELM
jgi:hypothetical protein